MRNVCFPFGKRTFSRAETYVFREENIENAGSLWKKCAGGASFSGRYLSCRLRKSRILWRTGDSVSCVFGRFSVFLPLCKEISGRIFPCFRCFIVPVRYASLPFPFTHAPMCAYTRPREIHNVVPFPSVLGSIKKRSPATVLFTAVYRKSSKNPQKSIA